MRSQLGRIYVIAAAALAFSVVWATVAARPWAETARPAVDPRLAALTAREHRLQQEAATVKLVVKRRWAVYERKLRARQKAIAAAKAQHARLVSLAQEAERRIAAQQAAAAAAAARQASYSAPATATRPTSAPAPAAAAPAPAPAAAPAPPPPAPKVVTLPPQVKVVTLPPVTQTSSSPAP